MICLQTKQFSFLIIGQVVAHLVERELDDLVPLSFAQRSLFFFSLVLSQKEILQLSKSSYLSNLAIHGRLGVLIFFLRRFETQSSNALAWVQILENFVDLILVHGKNAVAVVMKRSSHLLDAHLPHCPLSSCLFRMLREKLIFGLSEGRMAIVELLDCQLFLVEIPSNFLTFRHQV